MPAVVPAVVPMMIMMMMLPARLHPGRLRVVHRLGAARGVREPRLQVPPLAPVMAAGADVAAALDRDLEVAQRQGLRDLVDVELLSVVAVGLLEHPAQEHGRVSVRVGGRVGAVDRAGHLQTGEQDQGRLAPGGLAVEGENAALDVTRGDRIRLRRARTDLGLPAAGDRRLDRDVAIDLRCIAARDALGADLQVVVEVELGPEGLRAGRVVVGVGVDEQRALVAVHPRHPVRSELEARRRVARSERDRGPNEGACHGTRSENPHRLEVCHFRSFVLARSIDYPSAMGSIAGRQMKQVAPGPGNTSPAPWWALWRACPARE
jgi:hypothetical protein